VVWRTSEEIKIAKADEKVKMERKAKADIEKL
jgi:hypothetical protein